MARYGIANIENELLCPLQSVNVKSKFVDRFGWAVVTQEYENNSDDPIEAVFTFPKDDQAAITGLKVTTNNKTLIGQIEASDEAQEKYSDAIAEGKGAYLLSQKRSDIVTLYIGSLLPKQKVTLELNYVIEAQWEGESLRITFPTTIAPRYTPQQLQHDEDHQLNPVYHTNDNKLPYSFTFESQVQLTHDTISSFESPTHDFGLTLSGDRKEIKLEAALNSGDNLANRDIVLIVHSLEREQRTLPVMIDEVDENGHHALYLSFIPKIVSQATNLPKIQYEIVFLVDRSGSMAGAAMENCKAALLLFLRSLPSDSFFNVVSFGSEHVTLFSSPRAYDNASLDRASKHVQQFKADLGGTEMLAPLKQIFASSQQRGRKRVVFVLTDGEVSNANQVIDLVRGYSSTTSVYTFGVGSSVSRQLVNGMAEAGNGYAEYAAGNERLQPKIIRQLKSALSSFSVRVDWRSKNVKMFPKNVLPSNEDDPIHFMALIEDNNYLKKVKEIDLVMEANGKTLQTTFSLNSLTQVQGREVHQLFVKRKADSLSNSAVTAKKKKIQALCKKYHVLSNFTSFLVVERRNVATEKTPKFVDVPLAKPLTAAPKTAGLGKVKYSGDFSFCESYISTIGVDFKMNTVNLGSAGTAKSQNWDTAGQERFRSMTSSYYRGANGVIIVYSIEDRNSFDRIQHHYDDAVRSVSVDTTAFVLVGNKLDLQSRRQVSFAEGEAAAAKYNIPFFEVSAKDLSNLAEMVESIYNGMYMKQWENGASAPSFKCITTGESGVGKSAITDRMAGFAIDLSELAERYPMGTSNNAIQSSVNNQRTTTNTNESTGLLGKLWSGMTGFFGKKKAAQTITNSAPITQANQNSNKSISNTNNTTQSVGSTIGQTSPSNTNASTVTSKLSSKSMDAMLLLQEAAGNWKLHQHLAKLLNIDWTAIESAKPNEVKDDAWMTMICIAYLSVVCSQHKSEWELIVQKAENWLKSVGANRNEWNQRAKQLIQQSI